LFRQDGATVDHANFDNNQTAGAFLNNDPSGGPISFDTSTFNGNASGNNGLPAAGNEDDAGIAFDNVGTYTLTVTNSSLSNNGNSSFGGSGLYAYGGVDTVHLRANMITGNNTTQHLNLAGTSTNFGGITVAGGTVILDTMPAAVSGPYNHITGNGVGVVIDNDFGTLLIGNLTADDITHNRQAGVEIVGAPDLSGGVSVLRNSIYGSAFGAVPTMIPVPALAAPPPYYGYVNFGAGSGLNLDGNYFGTNTPSTLAVPTATVAHYVDIGGNHLGAGVYITLKVALNSPLNPVPANSTITVQATATLNDGAGNAVLDGTPVNFFVGVGPTVAARSGNASTTNGVAVGTFTVVTPASSGAVLKLWATAPDRAIAVAAGTILVLQQLCDVFAELRGPFFNNGIYTAEPSIDVLISQALVGLRRELFASPLGSVDVENAQTTSCTNVGSTTNASVTISGTALSGTGAYGTGDIVTSTLAYSSPTVITEVTDIWDATHTNHKTHSVGNYNVSPFSFLTTS